MKVHPGIIEAFSAIHGPGSWGMLTPKHRENYVKFADVFRKNVINKQAETLTYIPLCDVRVGDKVQVDTKDGAMVIGTVTSRPYGEIVFGSLYIATADIARDPVEGTQLIRLMRKAVVRPPLEVGYVIDVWHVRGDREVFESATAVCDGTKYMMYGGGHIGMPLAVEDILKWEERK